MQLAASANSPNPSVLRYASHGIAEERTIHESGADEAVGLMVKECVPFLASSSRTALLRTAYVGSPSDALSLPWIKGLPGEKRIQFLHGQVFVIQYYLGSKLVRAHIDHEQE